MTEKNDKSVEINEESAVPEKDGESAAENIAEDTTETASEAAGQNESRAVGTEDMDSMDEASLREYAKVLIEGLTKENEQLIKEQAELKKQIEKGNAYLDMLTALKSDFENYRRRTNAQAESSENEGRLFVLKKLLPVLDTFDRAREMLDEVTLTTFNLIVRQFDKVLADCGVEVIDVLGQPFDPSTANAVHSRETDKEEEKNVVLEVYANGYRYGDKVLRYAQVCVGV